MFGDKVTRLLLFTASVLLLLITAAMLYSLVEGAIPAFQKFGLGFVISAEWNPSESKENYGALPFIIGTLVTSVLALLICLPLSFATSLFLSEYFNKTRVSSIFGTMVDLLAGIPSIVYGLWGFYVLMPFVVDMGLATNGFNIFTASIILAIMIIPYATSISTEIIKLVPSELKEAAYALGATKREVIFNVVVPSASSGIVAGYILAFGRAIGETMAVTMLIGNSNRIPTSLFDAGNSMASIIANQFGEAEGLKLSSLIAIGLLLFVITAIINFFGKLIIRQRLK